MILNEYGEAASQVLDILNHTSKYDLKKIPKNFIEFLESIKLKNYIVEFDHTKPMYELNLCPKAKELLGFIYINWWSSEDERENFKNQTKKLEMEKQKELNEKYNPNNLFRNTKITQPRTAEENKIEKRNSNVEIAKYNENFFKTFINKILGFFKRKN